MQAVKSSVHRFKLITCFTRQNFVRNEQTRQRALCNSFRPSSRRMQILQAEEHSFFWGQPASTASITHVLPTERGPSEGQAASAAGASLSPVPLKRLARVSAAAFHSIAGAATVPELLQELQSALGEELEGGPRDSEEADGAVMLPPHVVEVAMAKVAGWALDPGSRAGTDPETVRQALELMQCSICLSGLDGYSLDDMASILWSLASVLGEYGWAPTGGCVSVFQRWLGSSGTAVALQTDPAAGRFSVLASLLWGYAALLQASNRLADADSARECTDCEAGGVHRVSPASSQVMTAGAQGAGDDAGPGVDALALRGAELTRAYGTVEPVAAVELADVAWALSVIKRKSPATGQLVEAVAHEVYRQLSNRSSLQAAFEPADLVKVVRAYADMGLDGRDGCVPRMLDAVGGHVAKRIRNRHVGAITRPTDCAELLRGFADSRHNTVVVPELLQAVALQICREVSTHNSAAPRPLDDHVCRDSSRTGSSNSSGKGGSSSSGSSSSSPPQRGDGKSGNVADRFRQPYTPLWEQRLLHWQQLGPEQRRRVQEEERTQAYWHWASLLEGAQVVSVLRSYVRMGFYPGVHLMDSLLLAVRPQLSALSSGDVSELLQLLAAVRHVPGRQMLDLLAAAALRPSDDAGLLGPERDSEVSVPARPSAPDRHQLTPTGPAADPLQRLASLWALVLMGWQPGEPDLVEEILVPVLLDESLALELQDVGRLMSLLVLLPRCELTIQRFGLAATKLQEALAATGDSGGSWTRHDSALGRNGSRARQGGSSRSRETSSQRQVRAALLASGAAMALLGAEGWEMAEQVLSGAQFRSVEGELRRALAEPNEGVDSSCLADVLQAMRDIGCSVAATTLTVPVDDLRLRTYCTGSRLATQSVAQPKPRVVGAAESSSSYGDGDDEETDGYFSPLVFRPLLGYIPSGEVQASPPTAPSIARIPDALEGPGAAGNEAAGVQGCTNSDSQQALGSQFVAVWLHVCPSAECASNAPEELLWGWSRVRQELYSACAGTTVALVLTEGKLRNLKGRREELKAYVRRGLEQALNR